MINQSTEKKRNFRKLTFRIIAVLRNDPSSEICQYVHDATCSFQAKTYTKNRVFNPSLTPLLEPKNRYLGNQRYRWVLRILTKNSTSQNSCKQDSLHFVDESVPNSETHIIENTDMPEENGHRHCAGLKILISKISSE